MDSVPSAKNVNRGRSDSKENSDQQYVEAMPLSIKCVRGWFQHVLPFLSLADVYAVSQSDPVLAVCVEEYFASGRNLLIDLESLRKYPVRSNREVYDQLNQWVTALTLSGITEEDVEEVFSIFKNIRSLTLKKLLILTEEPQGYPTNIETLKIIHCKMNKYLFKKWLKAASSTLESLHLKQVVYGLSLLPGKTVHPMPPLPKIRHLSLEQDNLSVDSFPFESMKDGLETLTLRVFNIQLPNVSFKSLRRLEIVAKWFSTNGTFPALEFLSLDERILNRNPKVRTTRILNQFKCNDNLRNLTLRYCPDSPEDIQILSQFKYIENLRILQSVEPEEKRKLESLTNIKNLLIHCFNVPEINKLFALNYDCLLEIMSYLSLDDLVALGQTHSRFDQLNCDYLYPTMEVNRDRDSLSTLSMRVFVEVLESIGKRARSLTLYDISDQEILCFKKLQKLTMSCDCFTDIPFTKFLKENASSLTSLEIRGNIDTELLSELHHIRRFKANEISQGNSHFKRFLQQNEGHLERLEIYDPRMDWTSHFSSGHLRNLKAIGLSIDDKNYTLKVDYSCLPVLEEIILQFKGSYDIIINQLRNLKNLQRLTVVFDHSDDSYFDSDGDLCDDYYIEQFDFRLLFALKTLRQFTIFSALPESEDVLLQIVKNLPNLIKLGTTKYLFTLQFEVALRKILADDNREMALYYKDSFKENRVYFKADE